MTFPVYFHLFGLRIHSHLAMELLGYTVGFQLYLRLRPRWPRTLVPAETNMWLMVGCVFGALIGSKLLAWVESAPEYWAAASQPLAWFGGKTIVGGLLGGWAGVELAKRRLHIAHSTGDVFVFPLIAGMSIGRIGCFLTGLDDHTYGVVTRLPWGIDFGDGIPRHPTQLYDIVFLSALGLALYLWMRSKPRPNGQLFRLFLGSYLLWRLAVEFIKPRHTLAALSPIQIASAAGAMVCFMSFARREREMSPVPG